MTLSDIYEKDDSDCYLEKVLWGSMCGRKETSQEASAVTQARDDGDRDNGGASEGSWQGDI